MDSEFELVHRDIKRLYKELPKKLDLQDGQKIWRNFQRFAEYSDFKSLYNKCIPEISRFEQRLIDFDASLKQQELILHRFDELVTIKADKVSIMKLYKHIKDETVIKEDFRELE